MSGLPTGTVTFLFTDIEGSTRLLQQLGDRYATVLMEYRRLLRTAIQERGGQEVDTQGDACFAVFPLAKDAMTAAVTAQRAIIAYPWSEGTLLRVRMGIHTGEAHCTDTGYIGMDVHRAARICAVGHGGQILLSDTARPLIEDFLPADVRIRDLGKHRLKDLARSQRLFQAVVVDLPADFPPLKSLDALPNNLPRQLTSFVGREKEMVEVKRLLSTSSLVTLTGTGGVGKTRLALQVAADLLDQYSDGVWLVELAPLSDHGLVPKAVASALGVPEQAGRQLTETVVDFLCPKSVLLVLDNCEHLLFASAQLVDVLLHTCAGLRILATSREPLGIPAEAIWRVPSLSVPDPSRLPSSPEQPMQYEAVRLFVERAAYSKPGFQVTPSNAALLAQLTHRLDGIPLAIELAAARVKALPVDVLAARLDDRFRLLTSGSWTGLPRHQTLRATLDWSYKLLSEQERILLRRLSAFAGGFALEAAEQICSGNGLDDGDILNLLTHLVDKSLVVFDEWDGHARYRLLETVRQYARDRLQESGEADDVRRRHRDWYLALAEQAYPELRGPRPELWGDRLETEHDNLRAALEWSKAEREGAEAGLRLAGALIWFWHMHGHWSEGRGWLESALARSNEARPSVLPKALQGATLFALRQGDYGRAMALGEKGVPLCRELEDKENGALLLLWLGSIPMRQGNYKRATTLFEESLSLCHEPRKRWLNRMALTHLGDVARCQGDYERAAALHMRSLILARDIGEKFGIAACLLYLGMDTLRQGDYRRSVEYFRESLSVSGEVGNRWVPVECLVGLAGVACAQQHYENAARLFGAVEVFRKSLGYRPYPPDQADHDQRVASTRAAIGGAAFAAAWADGRMMTLEQAIEYALASR